MSTKKLWYPRKPGISFVHAINSTCAARTRGLRQAEHEFERHQRHFVLDYFEAESQVRAVQDAASGIREVASTRGVLRGAPNSLG